MIPTDLLLRFYPSDRPDTTALFYNWVRDHLSKSSIVLNLGAGPATRMAVRSLRGEVARVIGADPDPCVLENDELDEAHVTSGGTLPFADDSFDLVISDFVLEHVHDAEEFLREVHRALKPGCPFLFRTPNLNHYATVVSRLTPYWFHKLVANRARGLPAGAHDPWPTLYRMNRGPALKRLADRSGFREVEIRFVEAHPAYLLFHRLPFMLGVAYERIVNGSERLSGLRVHILGKLVK